MSSPSTCPNCGSKISCGCQRRTAKDGKQMCSNCIAEYEQSQNRQTVRKDDQQLTVDQKIRLGKL